jgi:hypothetical protein
MSFTLKKELDSTRLIKTEEHLYNGSTTYNTDFNFYYNRNKLDSIVSVLTDNEHKDLRRIEVYTYKYDSNAVDVYVKSDFNPTPTRVYHYEYDSRGILSEFIINGKSKVLWEEKYFYNTQNKTIKTSSIERWDRDDIEVKKEKIYFMNNSQNIDSTYEYLIHDQKRDLSSIRIYKYDTKPNPYKNILYFSISEEYFNSNNVVSCQYLDEQHKERGFVKYNYTYDEKDKLIREFNIETFESDSIVHIYHYNK